MGTIIIAGNTVLKDMTTQLTIWRGLRGKLKPFLFTFLSIYQIFRALMFSYYEGTSRAHVQYKPKEDVRQKEAGIQVSSALLNFEYPKFSRNPLERNYQYPGNSRPDLIWGEVAKLSKQFSEPKIRTDYDVNKIGWIHPDRSTLSKTSKLILLPSPTSSPRPILENQEFPTNFREMGLLAQLQTPKPRVPVKRKNYNYVPIKGRPVKVLCNTKVSPKLT